MKKYVIQKCSGSFLADSGGDTDVIGLALMFSTRHEATAHSFHFVGSKVHCVEERHAGYNPESLRDHVHFEDRIAQSEISSPRKLLGNLFAFGLGIAFWVLLGVTWLG